MRNLSDRSLIALALVCVGALLLMAVPALMPRHPDRGAPRPADAESLPVATVRVCTPRGACASAY